MSDATVRAAVHTYFRAADIRGLHEVFSAPPLWVDGTEWQLNDTLGSGAIAAIHLHSDTESRVTVPAPNVVFPGGIVGQKMVTYTVHLLVFYQWMKPSATLQPVSEDAWAGPLDTIVDGLKTHLRADPTLGASGVVWQAGQGTADVVVRRDIPRQMKGKVIAFTYLEFAVDEVVTA